VLQISNECFLHGLVSLKFGRDPELDLGVVCDDEEVANFMNEQFPDFILSRNRLQDALFRKPAGSCSHRKNLILHSSVLPKGIRFEFLQVGADELILKSSNIKNDLAEDVVKCLD